MVDLSVNCRGSDYKLWTYGIAIIILICSAIFYPLYIIVHLIIAYKKKIFKTQLYVARFGFFFIALKKKFFYYDLLILVRKLSIFLILILHTDSIIAKNESYSLMFVLLILILSISFSYYY